MRALWSEEGKHSIREKLSPWVPETDSTKLTRWDRFEMSRKPSLDVTVFLIVFLLINR